jgi:hypothetical protein
MKELYRCCNTETMEGQCKKLLFEAKSPQEAARMYFLAHYGEVAIAVSQNIFPYGMLVYVQPANQPEGKGVIKFDIHFRMTIEEKKRD